MIKLTSIPQLYRNLNRSTSVFAVLAKYGLADWISRTGLPFPRGLLKDPTGDPLSSLRPETRVRLALADLGPTFIKCGQILSTRPDLVGVELANELQLLQDEVPADSPEVVRRVIEADLGKSIEELFEHFEPTPCASASIGQVHRARLRSGEEVAVKVRHEGVEEKIRVDLDILSGLAPIVEKLPEFARYHPRATVAEFRRMLNRELDFTREARHMRQFTLEFCDDPTVRVPIVFPRYSTSRVLTMEYLSGVKLTDIDRLQNGGFDLRLVARRGAELYLKMIFSHGFYHADPHPGNIVLLPANVIGLLDYGMVGRIDERLRELIEEMLMAIVSRDATHLTTLIMRAGEAPPGMDHAALSIDVSDFVAHYLQQHLDEFDLSGALSELIEILRRYRMRLPARVGMLVKVLIMLEGTARLTDPKFSLAEIITPFERKLVWKRLAPGRRIRKLRRFAFEVDQLVEALPRGLSDLMQQVRAGRYHVHLDHRGLEPSVNRLVLGMLASALFLGSAFLLSHAARPIIWLPLIHDISLFGLAGVLASIVLGAWALRGINTRE